MPRPPLGVLPPVSETRRPGGLGSVLMAGTLDPAARRGYGLGSVATGSFGTVPGLLLLPYLTDRLGVVPGVAGLIVFLPKAWDVLLNPIAGGISDRSTNPAGRRRPFLLRAGLTLAVAFVLLFSGPTSPRGLAAAWVVVVFLACATAYAFFQVPYVAMPAEMTDDYDERTRLMTWRVAILALAILVSGGLSPVIRNQLGPTWGYRGVGLFVGALIVVGTLGAWWGTRHTPMDTYGTAGAGLRRAAPDRRCGPGLPHPAGRVRHPGPRDRRDARRRRLRRPRAARQLGDVDGALRVLRRTGSARHSPVAALRREPGQAHRVRRRVGASRRWCPRDARRPARGHLAAPGDGGGRRGRLRRVPDVPARHARRRRGR